MRMVKHVVMWKLRDKNDAQAIKEALEALGGKIPGLHSVEVGIDFLASEQSADLILIAELDSREALNVYQEHPDHQAVIPMLKAAAIARTVVDFEG